ncbi:PAS domain S-box protein [Lacinutrix sp. C3R15]|uniref:PAS domain S-box protein n=1 Tax=Flavobacteriaceae TaxID=49546 RepID=UPI001C0819CE|nr:MULTISPECIES: PAS domain S-box protein [Flavobacteriaceae]MBU2939165.1 PAS domain S-box protein [Lacinutrix sp. C3R15]MDO6622481.1 PAS domain S-box protein [Oceanihabitans sp. 1_MG-2023]
MNVYTIILLELLLLSSSILLLFKFRTKLGLAPLYILLGSVQYLQANVGSSVSFVVFEDYSIYPGSIILFSGVLFAVLLIYIKEGAASARTLIFGIIISNIIMTLMFEITYLQQIINSEINNTSLYPNSVFNINFKFFLTGTFLLLIDFLLLVIIYQYLISRVKKLPFFLVLFSSLLIVLTFDSIAFNIAMFSGGSVFKTSLIGHLIGKSTSAFIFSVLLYVYLKYVDNARTTTTFIANKDLDVLSIIQYKKKYEELAIEKNQIKEKLTSKMENTLNNISDGFVSLDANWCYTFINKKAADILGKSPESLIGKHIWTEFPEGIELPFYKAYYKAAETQETVYFEDYYKPFDKWFENKIYPSPEGLLIYFTDITEKKKAEEKNQKLLSLIETSDEFIGLASLEGKPIYLNANGRKLVALDKEEAMPDSITDFFSEDYQETIQKEHLTSIFKTNKWRGEVTFKNFKTGDLIPIEMSGFLIKDSQKNTPIALGIVAKDITQRKESEEKLKNSELLFRRLTSNVPVGVFQSDKDGFCNYVNQEWLEYAGMSFNEAVGFGWTNAIHPEDKERVDQEWTECAAAEKEFISELRFVSKEKTTWLSVKAVGTSDINNNLYGYIGMALDITDRKKAEAEIKRSQVYLENIINNIGDPVFVKDDESKLLIVNDAFCTIFNLKKEAVIGKTLVEHVSAEEQEVFLKIDKEVIETGVENVNEETLTIKGKESRIISTKKTRFIDANGSRFLIGIIRDVTERKKTEIELEKHRNNLEELVKIRTEEVNSKNKELQRMNNLFIGRELKMKELKGIIKELKLKNDN